MCERYQLAASWSEVVHHYALGRALPGQLPRLPLYNVAPGIEMPVVEHPPEDRFDEHLDDDGSGWQLCLRPWGLSSRRGTRIPAIELGDVKAALRAGLQPCLVPTSGFYAWLRAGGRRWPLYFGSATGGLLTLAGLRMPIEGGPFAVITTPANESVGRVQERMPAVLALGDQADWLEPGLSLGSRAAMLQPAPAELTLPREVNTALNSYRAAGQAVLEADWSLSRIAA